MSPALLYFCNEYSVHAIDLLEYELLGSKRTLNQINSPTDFIRKLSKSRTTISTLINTMKQLVPDQDHTFFIHSLTDKISVWGSGAASKEIGKNAYMSWSVPEYMSSILDIVIGDAGEGTGLAKIARDNLYKELNRYTLCKFDFELIKSVFVPYSGENEIILTSDELHPFINKLTFNKFIGICNRHAPYFNSLIFSVINNNRRQLPKELSQITICELDEACSQNKLALLSAYAKFDKNYKTKDNFSLRIIGRKFRVSLECYDSFFFLRQRLQSRGVTFCALISELGKQARAMKAVNDLYSDIEKIHKQLISTAVNTRQFFDDKHGNCENSAADITYPAKKRCLESTRAMTKAEVSSANSQHNSWQPASFFKQKSVLPVKQETQHDYFAPHKWSNEMPLFQGEYAVKQENAKHNTKTYFSRAGIPVKARKSLKQQISDYKDLNSQDRATYLKERMKAQVNNGYDIPALKDQWEVVAARTVRQWELLGHYAGRVITEEMYDQGATITGESLAGIDRYSIALPGNKILSALHYGNVTSLINANTTYEEGSPERTPNVRFLGHQDNNRWLVLIVSLAEIGEGQPLWIDYGAPYWESMREPVTVSSDDEKEC